ncbi:OmpP1/FadL family transporter [Pseudomonas sp. GCM10022188]|uniref:OmpP1/FadL family transporter n=1 Tax=Pseudomonas TaxID=286 RepID=UPI0029E81EE3|nr:outer membrane protein transport protein [Pseudomonas oryzagri]
MLLDRHCNARVTLMVLLGLLPATSAIAGMPALAGISAKADTAETSISNPAGMSRLGERATTLRGALAQGMGEFGVDESRTTIGGGDPDDDASPALLPLGFHVRQLTDRVHAGISLTVPTGFGTDYGDDWAGRYYADSYSLVYVAVTPAVSYRLNEQWSIGGAVGINYTLSESEVAINTLGGPDGKLEAELDGIGTNVTLSALWEMNARTRFGVVYTTEATADLEGDLKFRSPGPVLGALLQQGLLPDDIEVENTLPQRINAGVYHELESGSFVTFDVMWVDFSEFGTSSISLDGTELDVDESGAYQDFWGVTLGYGFPANQGRRYSIGVLYVTAPTDDDERSLALPLDRMWGVGGGVQLTRRDGSMVDINLNLIDYGKGEVDTGPSAARGRVAGETDNPYLLVLDVAYHF